MDFRKVVDDYIFAFFLLGQSSYNPRLKVATVKGNVFNYIPAAAYWLLTASVSIFSLFVEYTFHHERNFSVLLSHLWVLIEQTVAITIFGSCFYYASLLPSIWLELENLERGLRLKLNIVIDFNEIRLRFRRKMLVIMVMQIVSTITRLPFFVPDASLAMTITYKVQALAAHLPVYHALFYIVVLRQFEHEFSAHVSAISNQDFRSNNRPVLTRNAALMRQLRQWRQAHHQLRNCFDLFNEYFGWILVASCMYMLYYIIWSIYWTVVCLCEDKPFKAIRNFAFYHFHLLYKNTQAN